MTKNAACIESALPERLLAYKRFSEAFASPDKKELLTEYDLLFRAKEIWLYSIEYLAENEFQRVNYLADIAGFYRAFGLETDRERQDFLNIELEFMHILIAKQMYALSGKIVNPEEKADICRIAQEKFFNTYLYPGAKSIAEKIIALSESGFYKRKAVGLLAFLESEREYFRQGNKE